MPRAWPFPSSTFPPVKVQQVSTSSQLVHVQKDHLKMSQKPSICMFRGVLGKQLQKAYQSCFHFWKIANLFLAIRKSETSPSPQNKHKANHCKVHKASFLPKQASKRAPHRSKCSNCKFLVNLLFSDSFYRIENKFQLQPFNCAAFLFECTQSNFQRRYCPSPSEIN